MKPGFWLIPTRRRLSELRALFEQALATGMSTPGYVLVQQKEYDELRDEYTAILGNVPGAWSVLPTESEGMAAKCAEAMATVLNRKKLARIDIEWVGVICDDNWPETHEWDKRLIERVDGCNIVASADGWQSPPRAQGAIVWSADVLRAVGYLAPSGLQHLFFDDVWEMIGNGANCLQHDDTVMVRHRHAYLTGKQDDTFRKVNSYWASDPATFEAWKQTDLPRAVESVRQMIAGKQPPTEQPDLSGISLQIATPCGDGRYEREYVKSWLNTILLIRALGGEVDWAQMPYCADVALARNKLVSNFHRGSHTHLLFIDDDMGWSPDDVVRLLLANRDFVAAAGRKKTDLLQFCVSNASEDGRRLPLHHELDTGLIECTEVGGAFVLLTRACVDRMVQGYPELAFNADHGNSDYALFDPLIENGWRLGEDFAFCRRWRRIGGRIYVLADVNLKHVGHKTYEGRWSDLFNVPYPMRDAAE